MTKEIGFIMGSVLVLAPGGCGAKQAEKEDEPGAAPVKVTAVTRGTIQRVITAEGILRAGDQVICQPRRPRDQGPVGGGTRKPRPGGCRCGRQGHLRSGLRGGAEYHGGGGSG